MNKNGKQNKYYGIIDLDYFLKLNNIEKYEYLINKGLFLKDTNNENKEYNKKKPLVVFDKEKGSKDDFLFDYYFIYKGYFYDLNNDLLEEFMLFWKNHIEKSVNYEIEKQKEIIVFKLDNALENDKVKILRKWHNKYYKKYTKFVFNKNIKLEESFFGETYHNYNSGILQFEIYCYLTDTWELIDEKYNSMLIIKSIISKNMLLIIRNLLDKTVNKLIDFEEIIELPQHNQKIMMMYELGIIDFLIDQYKLKPDNTIEFTKLGNIISSFTGIKLDSIRKTISAIYNKGEYGNNPYESKEGQPKKNNINKINAKFIQLDINKKKEY